MTGSEKKAASYQGGWNTQHSHSSRVRQREWAQSMLCGRPLRISAEKVSAEPGPQEAVVEMEWPRTEFLQSRGTEEVRRGGPRLAPSLVSAFGLTVPHHLTEA